MVTGVVPSPPRCVTSFYSRIGFSISTARPFSLSSTVANSCSRAFRSLFFMQNKVLTSTHSGRLQPTKYFLVGTRTTYQATGCISRKPFQTRHSAFNVEGVHGAHTAAASPHRQAAPAGHNERAALARRRNYSGGGGDLAEIPAETSK